MILYILEQIISLQTDQEVIRMYNEITSPTFRFAF